MTAPFFSNDAATLYHGDAQAVLASLEENSADAMVTDPPGGRGFMGLSWDGDRGGRDNWIVWLAGVMAEARRVLKPGAHILVWAMPRTSHWTGMAIEEAGFDVVMPICHVYGSGFPKNTRVSRWLTEERWEGWGNALKPAHEVWFLARAPLEKGRTIASNVEYWETGAINYAACGPGKRWAPSQVFSHTLACDEARCAPECPVAELDRQSGHTRSGMASKKARRDASPHGFLDFLRGATTHGDEGGASRFFPAFRGAGLEEAMADLEASPELVKALMLGELAPFLYCAKPSRKEKNAGLEDMPLKESQKWSPGGIQRRRAVKAEEQIQNLQGLDARGRTLIREDGTRTLVDRFVPGYSANHHATVKSIALMRWLIRLVTPRGGLVIDPFTGSGTTGCAAAYEGVSFLGAELDSEDKGYPEIARRRIEHHQGKAGAVAPAAPRPQRAPRVTKQLSLFGQGA